MNKPTATLIAHARELNKSIKDTRQALNLAAAELGIQTRMAKAARLVGLPRKRYIDTVLGGLHRKFEKQIAQ